MTIALFSTNRPNIKEICKNRVQCIFIFCFGKKLFNIKILLMSTCNGLILDILK